MILPYNASGEQLWDGCTRHLLTLCKPHSRNVHGFWWCLNELDSCSYEVRACVCVCVWDCCDQSNHIMIIRGIKRFKVHKILYMCLRSVYRWNARSCAERRLCMIFRVLSVYKYSVISELTFYSQKVLRKCVFIVFTITLLIFILVLFGIVSFSFSVIFNFH